MQIHEHVLFQSGLAVGDCDAVVVAIQSVNERLYGRFVQVAEIAGCLARFLTHHECLWVDEAEGIYDNFALDGLDGINDDSDGTTGKRFKRLLCVDVHGGEPAAEARMGVVPAYYRLWP